MTTKIEDRSSRRTVDGAPALDVVIIGAGFAGLYALHHLRGLGYDARIVEAGGGVGGTWYWNRYPGARVDIESVEYSYSFSDELQQEWNWTERYAARDELLRYLNHVADRFDLRRSIDFGTRVESAIFDEDAVLWTLHASGGRTIQARHCIMATGFLSAPNQPNFAGLDSFNGKVYHTAYWPEEGVDFSGQRVGVIGTGSSAIQCIPIIAQQAAKLTVFQRTPAYAVPLRNCPMPEEYLRSVKANYADWRHREREKSFGGWVAVNFKPIDQVFDLAMNATAEERTAAYEERWASGGLAFYNSYPDIFVKLEANATLAEFLRSKIRERVQDPETAELLSPRDYPALTKRLCADSGYYETFNRDNVSLVSLKANPIKEITRTGVQAGDTEYEFDSIVLATGFDALTGAMMRINVRGRGGVTLQDHWRDGARTAFGLMVAGFPNMFMLSGPGSPCPLFQPILLSEDQVRWIGDCLQYLDRTGHNQIEATQAQEDSWVQGCTDAVNATLFPLAKSWYMGSNVPGKPPIGLAYFGGIQNYWAICNQLAADDYRGFALSIPTASVAMAR